MTKLQKKASLAGSTIDRMAKSYQRSDKPAPPPILWSYAALHERLRDHVYEASGGDRHRVLVTHERDGLVWGVVVVNNPVKEGSNGSAGVRPAVPGRPAAASARRR